VVTLVGAPTKAEELRDYEAGYRAQLGKRFSLDATAFWSNYRRLQTEEPGTPYLVSSPTPYLLIPLYFESKAHAHDYGGEIFGTWTATNRWKIVAGYTQLHMNVNRDPSSQDTTVERTPGYSPQHQYQIRSLLNPWARWEWDTTFAYSGRLAEDGIPGIARLDTRIGWHPGEKIEFSLVGQNLLSPGHLEFIATEAAVSTLVQRSVFGKVTWRF